MVLALRYPDWFAMPELRTLKHWPQFRMGVHVMLVASYGYWAQLKYPFARKRPD